MIDCIYKKRLPYSAPGGSPVYWFTYIVCGISTVYAATNLVAIASLFMSACLIVIAGLHELRDMIVEIDGRAFLYSEDWRLYVGSRDTKAQHRILQRYRECFVFHWQLLRIIEIIEEIFSPIIFVQYLFCMMGLCTLVFGLQTV